MSEMISIFDLLPEDDEMRVKYKPIKSTDWKWTMAEDYAKASEVAREIIDILKSAGIDEWRYPVIAELKKKYTAEMKKIKIGEWVYGKFDIPHCSECGYEPTEISPFCPMCNANMESEDAE